VASYDDAQSFEFDSGGWSENFVRSISKEQQSSTSNLKSCTTFSLYTKIYLFYDRFVTISGRGALELRLCKGDQPGWLPCEKILFGSLLH
jgi:hypothetical protein